MNTSDSRRFYLRDSCRLCKSRHVELVLPLTPTALCDAYIPAARSHHAQEVFPLDLFMCRDCGYVFIPCVVDPSVLYKDYIYITTSSLGLTDHFDRYAEEVINKTKSPRGSLIVDIGSNDGTLLQCFKRRGYNVLGIEPAEKIAMKASERGIKTIPDFFSSSLADKILVDSGPASIITMNNLFANIDDLEGVTDGVRKLLAPEGVFIIESSYLSDMINNMVFDFIYHEHLSYFSVKPLDAFFRRFDMQLFYVERVPTKGGSLRYYIQRAGGNKLLSNTVNEFIAFEHNTGLYQIESFEAFSEKIKERKFTLVNLLNDLRSQGKSVVGYGASATTTTLIYHFGLHDKMSYIVDDNPAKHFMLSPGHHIPVLPSDTLYEKRPDYVIILAWRYLDPIIKRHRHFLNQGGHFIRPLPVVEIN